MTSIETTDFLTVPPVSGMAKLKSTKTLLRFSKKRHTFYFNFLDSFLLHLLISWVEPTGKSS